MTVSGDCDICERHYLPHEGPQSARTYSHTARDVASALVALGRGMSYREVSADTREVSGREPEKGETSAEYRLYLSRLRNGQLCADWTEVFAPVIWEHYRQELVDQYELLIDGEGTLVLDEIPFKSKGGPGGQGGQVLFWVLGALSATTAPRSRLQSLQAFYRVDHTRTTAWREFLSTFPEAPKRVVCDDDNVIKSVVRELWPDTEIYSCEWHRAKVITEKMKAAGMYGAGSGSSSDKREAVRKIQEKARAAVRTVDGWDALMPDIHAHGDQDLVRFFARIAEDAFDHFDRRPSTAERQSGGMPVTTGALETKLKKLRDDRIRKRQSVLTNPERLNRLLRLMQLDLDNRATERAYAKIIRDWLNANEGRPTRKQRELVGASSGRLNR